MQNQDSYNRDIACIINVHGLSFSVTSHIMNNVFEKHFKKALV